MASTPDTTALASNTVWFGRLLHRAGLATHPSQTRLFLRALLLLGLHRKGDIKAAGRAVFTQRREERATYDSAFELFWRRLGDGEGIGRRIPRIRQGERRETASPGPGADRGGDTVELSRAFGLPAPSTREAVRRVDFAALTPEEARDAERMLEGLRARIPRRRARRSLLALRGHRPAGRSMLRRALGTGGEALEWRWLRRTTRPRPIVLVCDISGSMERYSRFLLRFGHALQRSGAPVEVFVFGTRLTRITRELRVRSPDAAIRRVADRVVDWNGGTLIGESLRTLNRTWVRRTIRSGAVVLLVSDGWERGDPELLAREMATLRRSCHRLLWLDPLASRPGFAPATVGLRAALPHVDGLVPCGTVESLEQLGARIGRWAEGPRGGRLRDGQMGSGPGAEPALPG